jgi:hypothetical protein
MLGPIIQALWQQVGPQAQQYFTSPAFTETIRIMMKLPLNAYVEAGKVVSASASSWYDSLSFEDKKRIMDAIAWVIKDLSGFAANQLTGLPIGSLVEQGVGLVLANLEHPDPSPQEVVLIKTELEKRMLPGSWNDTLRDAVKSL